MLCNDRVEACSTERFGSIVDQTVDYGDGSSEVRDSVTVGGILVEFEAWRLQCCMLSESRMERRVSSVVECIVVRFDAKGLLGCEPARSKIELKGASMLESDIVVVVVVDDDLAGSCCIECQ
jgi:hypothetical protein